MAALVADSIEWPLVYLRILEFPAKIGWCRRVRTQNAPADALRMRQCVCVDVMKSSPPMTWRLHALSCTPEGEDKNGHEQALQWGSDTVDTCTDFYYILKALVYTEDNILHQLSLLHAGAPHQAVLTRPHVDKGPISRAGQVSAAAGKLAQPLHPPPSTRACQSVLRVPLGGFLSPLKPTAGDGGRELGQEGERGRAT